MIYRIERSEMLRRMSFPLIQYGFFTGEDINPWRCECCLTKKQRQRFDKNPQDIQPVDSTYKCCRKCGVELS